MIMNRAGWSMNDTATSMMVAFFVLQANAADGAGWSVLHLIQSPKTLNLIREEMKMKLNETQISRWNSTSLSPINIPLSNSIIDETLRLTTSVFSMRIVESDDQTVKLTKDFKVRNGTRLITVNRASSLDINIWGPKDPKIWIPNRLNQFNRKSLLHFGSGQTKCAGMRFAQIELVSILLGFLNRFDCQLLRKDGYSILMDDLNDQIIGYSPGFLPPTVGLGVVMKPREEVWVNLRLRNLNKV
ncbi:cytochrome P450 [Melampsora americana]|nr:cytochrome P450 [Melampsora americana]